MGKAGNGTKMKLVGNLLVASQIVSIGEALSLAKNAGLELRKVLEVAAVADFKTPIYAGVGAGLGTYSNSNINNGSGTFVFAAGDVGIEYNFDFPLQASLDLRPEIGGNGYFENSFGTDIALGIRYKF